MIMLHQHMLLVYQAIIITVITVITQARAEEEFGLDENAEPAEGDDGAGTTGSGLPWDGTDRDYTYEELLGMKCCHMCQHCT